MTVRAAKRRVRINGEVAFGVIAILAIAAYWGIDSLVAAIRSHRLDGRFPQSIAFKRPEREPFVKPYVLGRMAVIDVKNRKVDGLWYELPEDRRANDDSEVDTIVLVKWSREGEDWGNPDAGGWIAEVEVVDPSIPAVVGDSERFHSPMPEYGYHIHYFMLTYKRPYDQIVYYLTSLPRTKQKPLDLHDTDPKLAKELHDLLRAPKEEKRPVKSGS